MGYKTYGEDRSAHTRWKEFVEWLVVMCLWFPSTIGGWLVLFGLPLVWMVALTIAVAITAAWHLSKSEIPA
jgi:hypothetical protein